MLGCGTDPGVSAVEAWLTTTAAQQEVYHGLGQNFGLNNVRSSKNALHCTRMLGYLYDSYDFSLGMRTSLGFFLSPVMIV